MRIAHALGWYMPESLGGTEVYVEALASAFRARGDDVFIAAPTTHSLGESRYEWSGVPVFRYPIPERPTRDECQGRSPARGAEHFVRWLEDLRPNLLHVHSLVTGLSVRELRRARDLGIRVVFTNHLGSLGYLCQRGTVLRWGTTWCDAQASPHKCAPCLMNERGVPKTLARFGGVVSTVLGSLGSRAPGRLGSALGLADLVRWNLLQQRELIDVVDRFVVLCQWTFDALVKTGAPPTKLRLNRLGVSTPETLSRRAGPVERPTCRPVRVAYLGRFTHIKGAVDLCRAVRALPADVQVEVQLRGPWRTAEPEVLEALKEHCARDPRLRLGQHVEPRDVGQFLREIDVLCCPSRAFEHGPTSALEARAVGTPAIGTRIGAMPEFIIDGVDGALLPPGDWRALSRLLVQIAGDPEGTIDRWRAALPRVARTMADVTHEYERIYKELR